MAVATDPSIDVIVEVMGGISPARELLLAALGAGKPVITANKALLAAHGSELFAAAEAAGVDLLFEAAVAGGIPFIRPLRESLLAEPVLRVMGIMNGTTNYILTRMSEAGADYSDALAEAQSLGYAEADPTADVEGHDAAAKIAIVASIAMLSAKEFRRSLPTTSHSRNVTTSPSNSLQLPSDFRDQTVTNFLLASTPVSCRTRIPLRQYATVSMRSSFKVKPWAISCSTDAALAAIPRRLRFWATWLTQR
jgi:hypothetical protein